MIISREAVQALYDDGTLVKSGTFHAQVDDVKDIILCHLAHITPKKLGGGKRIEVRDRILRIALAAWKAKHKEKTTRLTGNIMQDIKVIFSDMFLDLLDEELFQVFPSSNPKKRKFRTPAVEARQYLRSKIKRDYLGSLTLSDFDVRVNEAIIAQHQTEEDNLTGDILDIPYNMSKVQELMEAAQEGITDAADKDMVEPDSIAQHLLLQEVTATLEEAEVICNMMIAANVGVSEFEQKLKEIEAM